MKKDLNDETWQHYQKYLQQQREFDGRLLQLLHRELAEVRADLDADGDDPDLLEEHSLRLLVLACQIDGIIKNMAPEPSTPTFINARRPRPSKKALRATQKALIIQP